MEKRTNKRILRLDIIFYVLIVIIGFCLIETSNISRIQKLIITEFTLYIIGFASILLYVINRRKKDSEFLELGLICILTSTFIQLNERYNEPSVILANAFVIFSFLYVSSKVYHSYKLIKNKDINYLFKLSAGIVVGLLGIYFSLIIFRYYLFSDYILGYYYILFGFINLVEQVIELLIENPAIEKKIKKLIKIKDKNNTDKKKPVIRKIPNKKITRIKK